MFAQVIVDVPVKQVNRPFDYRIPTIFEGEIEVGMRVVVPFAGRSVQGFVVSIRPTSDFDGELKEIERLMDLEPVLSKEMIELGEYMSNHLFAFLIHYYQTMLPAMLKTTTRKIFILENPQEHEEIFQRIFNGQLEIEVTDEMPKETLAKLLRLKQKGIVQAKTLVEENYSTEGEATKKKAIMFYEFENNLIENELMFINDLNMKVSEILGDTYDILFSFNSVENSDKKLKISLTKLRVLIGGGALLALGILLYIFKYHDQLRLVISKFLYTFMEPYYSVLTTQVISGTSTVAIPAWFYPIQYGALILLFLSYTKEQVPRWFAWLGLLINLINLFGVLFKFAIDPAFTEHVITGPQGRYFTVFILLLAPSLTLLAQKISVKTSGAWLRRIVLSVSVMALVLNLSVTMLRSYHLQLPMDEYRSGIEHYIFK